MYEASYYGNFELGAVNEMLSAIGESAVSTLEGEANEDVANARRILYNVNREIQSKGWTFNIEQGAVLYPDVYSKLIPYEMGILKMESTSGTIPYVNLGGYVYDRLSKTDRFDAPIIVDLIRMRTLEEMPECFQRWIVTRASRKFAIRFFGDPAINEELRMDEETARMDCNTYETDTGKYNALTGDNFITAQLSRG